MIKQKHILRLFRWFLCCGVLCNVSIAQETNVLVNAGVDRTQVMLGEQFKLKIELTKPSAQPVTQWFNIPDTFNHLEIIDRSGVDSSLEGTIKKYVQQFTITGFDSGVWNIPAFPVIIANKTYSTQPITVTIVPVQLSDSTYHDIREIINVPEEKTPWWYWLAGVLSLILLGVLLWLWLKKRNKQPGIPAADNAARLTALQEAIDKLQQLKRKELPARSEWKMYYSELSGIVKAYAQQRFALPALQYTTDELLIQLNTGASRETLGKLAESLRIGDAVKFAKYHPGTVQATKDIEDIEKVLRDLDRLK